jgi:hypothetical protein
MPIVTIVVTILKIGGTISPLRLHVKRLVNVMMVEGNTRKMMARNNVGRCRFLLGRRHTDTCTMLIVSSVKVMKERTTASNLR